MASQSSANITTFQRGGYSAKTFSLSSTSLPSRVGSSREASQLIGQSCKLRVEYQEMKARSLRRLQELLNEIKWIDDKISEVDIHIGRIYHVVDSSGFGIPPPIVAHKEHTIVIEGTMHSVQLGADEKDGHLSVILD